MATRMPKSAATATGWCRRMKSSWRTVLCGPSTRYTRTSRPAVRAPRTSWPWISCSVSHQGSHIGDDMNPKRGRPSEGGRPKRPVSFRLGTAADDALARLTASGRGANEAVEDALVLAAGPVADTNTEAILAIGTERDS